MAHRTLIVVLLGAWLAVSPAASGPAADDAGSGLDRMVHQIQSKFPFLEGYVLEVQGSQIILDLKQGQDLKPGDRLRVVRYGQDIIHPVTKKKVGRREQDLTPAVVTEVRRDYSIARLENPAAPVQKGDGVRSFFRKVTILVAPVKAAADSRVDAPALRLEIEDRLNSNPRFQVPAFDLELWLTENGLQRGDLPTGAVLLRLQKKVDVDFLLLPEVARRGARTELDYRLISAVDGTVLTQSRLLAGGLPERGASRARPTRRTAPRARGQVQTGFQGESGFLEFLDKQEFPFAVVDMDAGDLDGDGKTDYVLIDDHRVRFYKYKNGRFRQVGLFKARSGNSQFLAVDVADINGNGVDEVFVTSSLGNRLDSLVLERVRGKRSLRRLWEDANLYFRIIRPFGKKPRLLVQKPGHDRPFRPDIYEYVFKGGRYVEKTQIPLPHIPGNPLITIYGLTQGNITSSKAPQMIFLDNEYHLRVYSANDRMLVKSDDYYGQDPRIIDVALKEQIPGMHNPDGDVQPVHFRGRLLLREIRGDRYLLLPKNHQPAGSLIGKLAVVNNSSLVVLRADKEGLHRVHATRKQPGYLAAYQVVKAPEKGRWLVHAVHVSGGGALGNGKKISAIFTYRW